MGTPFRANEPLSLPPTGLSHGRSEGSKHQPRSRKSRVSHLPKAGCDSVKVAHQLRVVGRAAANHVEVQVAFHLINKFAVRHKMARTQQALFLAVPKSKDNRTLRLFAAHDEGTRHLQHRHHARSIVVGPIVNAIVGNVGKRSLMVVVCAPTMTHSSVRLPGM